MRYRHGPDGDMRHEHVRIDAPRNTRQLGRQLGGRGNHGTGGRCRDVGERQLRCSRHAARRPTEDPGGEHRCGGGVDAPKVMRPVAVPVAAAVARVPIRSGSSVWV